MREILAAEGINLNREMKKIGLNHTVVEWPFVYIYERSDMSVKLYGAIIYPEHIRNALLHQQLASAVTGKFTMLVKTDKQHKEYLEIHLELKPKQRGGPSLQKKAAAEILKHLLEKNAEYHYLFNNMPGKVEPKLTFWDNAHPLYFNPRIKQRWVQK